MPRIRTIKPEFWTDSVMVQLPFEARLLFVGLWNLADDYGCIEDEPDRIRLSLFPGDPQIEADSLIDLLDAAERIERVELQDGQRLILIPSWSRHQKVDNPSQRRLLREPYRKLAIPQEVRRAVAAKYGCQPGEVAPANCYYCGAVGQIYWHRLYSGRPSGWVAFGQLELDHFKPELAGGGNASNNIVLACRPCNRRKAHGPPLEFLQSRLDGPPSTVGIASTIEPSPMERKGKEEEGKGTTEAIVGLTPDQTAPLANLPVPANGNGKHPARTHDQIKDHLTNVLAEVQEGRVQRLKADEMRTIQAEVVFAFWQAKYGHMKAKLDDKRLNKLKKCLVENDGNVHELLYAIDGWDRDTVFRKLKAEGSELDGIDNIFKDRERIERLAGHMKGNKAGEPHPTAVKYLAGLTL